MFFARSRRLPRSRRSARSPRSVRPVRLIRLITLAALVLASGTPVFAADTWTLDRMVSPDRGDVNGFKLLAFSDRDGARALQCVPGPDPAHVGSPQYQKGKVAGPNRVAQHGNLAIWLVRNGKSPWTLVVPQSVRVSQSRNVTFLEFDRTWVAVHGLGATPLERNEALTKQVTDGEKARFPEHQVLTAVGVGQRFCGLAFEVGEKQSHGGRDEFRQQALRADIDLAKLDEGIVQYKSADGKWLGFHWNDNANDLGCWRNGKRHDWSDHARHVYRTADRPDATPVIESVRGTGKLLVEAGGHSFACEVNESGQVTFRNAPVNANRR